MTPESQRIAIAEACKWTVYNDGRHYVTLSGEPIGDPLNDLNAMHEAEKVLTNDQKWEYREILPEVCPTAFTFHTTAAQRAEVFLRCLGKWVD